ncbi:MAG TPA: OsmC family protein [Steroidobacter sp.]|jgi:organic hydroperoxide reductase OsmC/OhrA|nr:OsmC family protein [Steroidobacteraceae bacterium]HLS82436.1 OsmC family protein [Steroidobacter sp.]
MQPLPHFYAADAAGAATGAVALDAAGLPQLTSAAPREFGGPGDAWSPEALLVASLASCFILTFRAVARASKLEWSRIECSVQGTLDRVDGVTQFTHFVTKAKLTTPDGVNVDACARAIEKAERGCLIANSLRAKGELQFEIVQTE